MLECLVFSRLSHHISQFEVIVKPIPALQVWSVNKSKCHFGQGFNSSEIFIALQLFGCETHWAKCVCIKHSIITGLLLGSTWWLESTCGMRGRAQRLSNNNEWQHLTRYVKGHDCFAPIWPQFWGKCLIAAASLLHEHSFQPCAIRDHARIASHVRFLSGVVVLVRGHLVRLKFNLTPEFYSL